MKQYTGKKKVSKKKVENKGNRKKTTEKEERLMYVRRGTRRVRATIVAVEE